MQLLFVLFVLVYGFNKTNITIDDLPFSSEIDIKSNIEIKFKSENNLPFKLKIYTADGRKLLFKGTIFKYTGKVTYYELENLSKTENNIIITISSPKLDLFKIVLSCLAVCSLLVITFLKRSSKISKFFMVVLICLEIYRASDYTTIGDRIIRKTLF